MDRIGFDDLVKLYVNHRPVFAVGPEQIKQVGWGWMVDRRTMGLSAKWRISWDIFGIWDIWHIWHRRKNLGKMMNNILVVSMLTKEIWQFCGAFFLIQLTLKVLSLSLWDFAEGFLVMLLFTVAKKTKWGCFGSRDAPACGHPNMQAFDALKRHEPGPLSREAFLKLGCMVRWLTNGYPLVN